ncbi:MAG: dethiobiotin synthase [Planctomycetes bacterium]|nr:dethiobiotin synthase [Planctomycetota bacterium]
MQDKPRGLFITGTDTDVGKTYVGCLIARALRKAGHRVGVYKPAASGCRMVDGELVSDDALMLWEAAGRPGTLADVCSQRFAAPLAPHLAALAEGRALSASQMREGFAAWRGACDVLLVEGAGGLMSPLGEDEYNATLAEEFGLPLLVVARNKLGTINHTLQTLIAAAAWGDGLPVTGIVLIQPTPPGDDPSIETNRRELEARAVPPLLAEVRHGAETFDTEVDWFALCHG